MTRLTEPQTRALHTICDHGPARPSNITAPGRIYWQVADGLVADGYLERDNSARLVLTDTGRQTLKDQQ